MLLSCLSVPYCTCHCILTVRKPLKSPSLPAPALASTDAQTSGPNTHSQKLLDLAPLSYWFCSLVSSELGSLDPGFAHGQSTTPDSWSSPVEEGIYPASLSSQAIVILSLPKAYSVVTASQEAQPGLQEGPATLQLSLASQASLVCRC